MPAPPAAAITFAASAPTVAGDTSVGWHTLAHLVREHFDAAWSDPEVAVVYENENGVVGNAPAAFLLVEVAPGRSGQAGFGGGPGGNLWLEPGAILLRLFWPRGEGVAAAAEALAAALGLFRDRRLGASGIFRCTSATAVGLGSVSDDGNYWQMAGQVAVTWYRTA